MPNNSNVSGLLCLEEHEEDELAISGSTFGMPTPLVSPVPQICAFCLLLSDVAMLFVTGRKCL